MNLKGQWKSLKYWQKNRLIGYAISKEWTKYWHMKWFYLNYNMNHKEQEV